MDETGRNFPPGDLRVSDADRDRALAELGDALRVGRITAEEFGERSELALRSRTGHELASLVADLPPASPPAAPAALAALAAPAPLTAPAAPAVSSGHIPAVRGVMVASTVAAAMLGLSAVTHALRPGPTLSQREQIQVIAASHGLSIPLPPPPPIFWPGVVIPGVLALLLVALVIYLHKTRRHPRPASNPGPVTGASNQAQ
jgi:Domain of unknown function (DUF1707)